MKLRDLEIRLLPGIDDPFRLDHFGDGLHVVLGPNGIGKSSLARAMRSLLWRDGAGTAQVVSSARFDSDDGEYLVTRETSSWRWQLDGLPCDAPKLPGSNLAPCFFLGLRELLDTAGNAGGDVARAIRDEMSGGYNLAELSERFSAERSLRAGGRMRTTLKDADLEVRKAAMEQKDLEGREGTLVELQDAIDEARLARQRSGDVTTAIELHSDRAELDESEQQLAELPTALAQITGGELGQLDIIKADVEKKERSRQTEGAALDGAKSDAKQTGLSQQVESALLATAKARAGSLAETETRLARAQESWRGAVLAVSEASQRLGGRKEAPVGFNLQDGEQLFNFLREVEENLLKQGVIEERLASLGKTEASADSITAKQLQRGIEQLRIWLRSPALQAPVASVPSAKRGPSQVLAIALVAIGLGLGFAIHSALFAVAGVGLGLLIRSAPTASTADEEEAPEDWRASAQREFERLLEPVAEWSESEVAVRLLTLEDELAERILEAKEEASKTERRKDLLARLDTFRLHFESLDERREGLARELGLEEILPGAQLVDLARAMDQLRDARRAEREAAGKLEEIRAQQDKLLVELAKDLEQLGEPAPKDSFSALACVESLEQRDASLRAALKSEEQAAKRLEELDAELVELQKRGDEVFHGAGVASRAELEVLVARLEEFHELTAQHGDLTRSIQRSEKRLADSGEQVLVDMSLEQLLKEQGQAEVSADSIENLLEQKARIESDVERARLGIAIEVGLSAKDKALEKLEGHRDEALFAAAGAFLIQDVRAEHDTDSMPTVLEDARKLFDEFTQSRYDLRVHPSDERSFVAVEVRTGQSRNLEELSDGTRIQLALAARLAFVKQAEQGHSLPLFLDEALDHSDPVRFHAIACSLAKMVRAEGRQIFYLTSDQSDVARLQAALDEEGAGEVQVIDLAKARGREAAVRSAAELVVAPRPKVPVPDRMSVEEYGAALEVPRLNPRKGAADQHIFYLLGDELSTLQKLLELPIESVGQWGQLRRGSASVAIEVEAASVGGSELSLRASMLEVFCGLWLEGRGKLVDRVVLEASEALTANSLGKVAEIAKDLGGDPQELVQTLRDRSPHPLAKGFQRRQAEALEEYLKSEGYIDEREQLDEPGMIAKALTSPAASKLPSAVASSLLHQWWSMAVRMAVRCQV